MGIYIHLYSTPPDIHLKASYIMSFKTKEKENQGESQKAKYDMILLIFWLQSATTFRKNIALALKCKHIE